MGPVHRAAIERARNLKLVRGAFSETRQGSLDCREPLGLGIDDVYGAYRDFLRHEAKLPLESRVGFVAAVLPNMMHYPIAMTAMDAGVPVLGEKPFTVNLDEAANLVRKQRLTKVPYRIAMVYPAYPALVKARKLIQEGELGNLRRFVFSYQSGWMAQRIENQTSRQALWRTDYRRNGMGGVVTACAADCQFVLEWLTGLSISEVCATGRPTVPGRLIPDDATVLVRTESGIAGVFMLSQIAIGHHDGLELEITGAKASISWRQSRPGQLVIVTAEGRKTTLDEPSAEGTDPTCDLPYGANPAYVEALSQVYADFADSLRGVRKAERSVDDHILGMSMEEGLRSVAVVEAMVKSMGNSLPDQSTYQFAQQQLKSPAPESKWVAVKMPAV